MGTDSFSELKWSRRFLEGTPGDKEVGGQPRQVPHACWSRVEPTHVPEPILRLWSKEMAEMLNVKQDSADILGGNRLVSGMDPYSQRYGGHQFGNWANQLGDGRAITLGEVDTGTEILELQLKGPGITPYSRFADGKAVLRSSIREFLCSEAMHHLGIPTTRALSLVTTGEEVIRDVLYNGNPAPESGAIVCRVAPSFLRFGSFQIHSMNGDKETLRTLVDYTVQHHFPDHSVSSDDGLVNWLKQIAEETAYMISEWMRVGFVHGVMNTDNMSIHGLTIDYGPYGWIEDFNPNWTPNTTDARTGRYRFGHQAQIGAWNFARFLESISPLMDEPERLYESLEAYYNAYEEANNAMWCKKLGLGVFQESDEELIKELTANLQLVETDMTIFFRLISAIETPDIELLSFAFYDQETIPADEWNQWLIKWWERTNGEPNREVMLASNPKYVLRNWMAQRAIDSADKEDYSVAETLYELLKNPYDEQVEHEGEWFQKRPEWARNRVGCSMLSCSS
ncbi:MAG: protein adenylyltransferase SelO [Candidatus Poseidoniaceae archaeon]